MGFIYIDRKDFNYVRYFPINEGLHYFQFTLIPFYFLFI